MINAIQLEFHSKNPIDFQKIDNLIKDFFSGKNSSSVKSERCYVVVIDFDEPMSKHEAERQYKELSEVCERTLSVGIPFYTL